jgi:hypothetical protein
MGITIDIFELRQLLVVVFASRPLLVVVFASRLLLIKHGVLFGFSKRSRKERLNISKDDYCIVLDEIFGHDDRRKRQTAVLGSATKSVLPIAFDLVIDASASTVAAG